MGRNEVSNKHCPKCGRFMVKNLTYYLCGYCNVIQVHDPIKYHLFTGKKFPGEG